MKMPRMNSQLIDLAIAGIVLVICASFVFGGFAAINHIVKKQQFSFMGARYFVRDEKP